MAVMQSETPLSPQPALPQGWQVNPARLHDNSPPRCPFDGAGWAKDGDGWRTDGTREMHWHGIHAEVHPGVLHQRAQLFQVQLTA
jgi:hypothetical protein